MTITQTVLPIKVRVLVVLSIGPADCKGIAELLSTPEQPVKVKNLRNYMDGWVESGVIQKLNPGSHPVMYDLADKGKSELVLVGRRR